ncbi:MAG: hypothetical protein LBE12_00505 [Planctomycetaceae bacterium]|jgi:hypothetical protein|nr:hypothetical protein [Planctomycetaceae bacterium]
MLRRFIEWLDSLSDNINPLVVRDIRRMFRMSGYLGLLGLYCVLVIFIVIISWDDILITL